jgi:hypothetical protein
VVRNSPVHGTKVPARIGPDRRTPPAFTEAWPRHAEWATDQRMNRGSRTLPSLGALIEEMEGSG